MKRLAVALLALALVLAGCDKGPRIQPIDTLSPTRTPMPTATPLPTPTPVILPRVEPSGLTVMTRFNPNSGFVRIVAEGGTFASYLQNLALKDDGAEALLSDGTAYTKADYKAVVLLPITDKNIQAAGAIALLRAHYFYDRGLYEKIEFGLKNGFDFQFSEWRQGKRPNDPLTSWRGTAGDTGDGEENFAKYLKLYFVHSNMASLKADMLEVEATIPISIGDIFITQAASPRAIIVVDAQRKEDGTLCVMLAEGGKPATEIRILDNGGDSTYSPWFMVDAATNTIRVDETTTLSTAATDAGAVRFRFDAPQAVQEEGAVSESAASPTDAEPSEASPSDASTTDAGNAG